MLTNYINRFRKWLMLVFVIFCESFKHLTKTTDIFDSYTANNKSNNFKIKYR